MPAIWVFLTQVSDLWESLHMTLAPAQSHPSWNQVEQRKTVLWILPKLQIREQSKWCLCFQPLSLGVACYAAMSKWNGKHITYVFESILI